MTKTQYHCFIVIAGAIIFFIFMKFLKIEGTIGQCFSGDVFAYSIVSIAALLFGAAVSCFIGLFGALLVEISDIFSSGFSARIILFILFSGIYGFVLGKIFKKLLRKINENKNIKNIILFVSWSFIMCFVTKFLIRFISLIISLIKYNKLTGNSILYNIKNSTPEILIYSISVAIIGLLIVIIYKKFFKGSIPYVDKEEYSVKIDMLEFVKKAFRWHLNIVLWVNLILCTIGGGIIAGKITAFSDKINEIGRITNSLTGINLFSNNSAYNDYTLFGFIIGFIVGLMINIIIGGFIATIISIDRKLEKLAGKEEGE